MQTKKPEGRWLLLKNTTPSTHKKIGNPDWNYRLDCKSNRYFFFRLSKKSWGDIPKSFRIVLTMKVGIGSTCVWKMIGRVIPLFVHLAWPPLVETYTHPILRKNRSKSESLIFESFCVDISGLYSRGWHAVVCSRYNGLLIATIINDIAQSIIIH